MLDRRHGVVEDRISSFNPAYKIHNNCDGTGDIEFDFWGARETWYYNNNKDNLDDHDGSEVEFQVGESCLVEDCPSPLWGANYNNNKKVSDDASPLLPNNHFYSNLSPSRRRQLIEDGRKELMEMIRDMPESTYELSLKDLVDQKVSSETVKEKVVSEAKRFDLETETTYTKAKAMVKEKAGSLSRSASMETDHFLLKMVFPTSLSFKKKSTAENSSKVSPTPSCEASEKPVEKQWWIKRIFTQRNHKNKQDCTKKNSRKSRDTKRSSVPGCWLFFLRKKR